jgi:hypothetical protein
LPLQLLLLLLLLLRRLRRLRLLLLFLLLQLHELASLREFPSLLKLLQLLHLVLVLLVEFVRWRGLQRRLRGGALILPHLSDQDSVVVDRNTISSAKATIRCPESWLRLLKAIIKGCAPSTSLGGRPRRAQNSTVQHSTAVEPALEA